MVFKIEYDQEPYSRQLVHIRELLDSVRLVVGFNLKFDLAWLARYGIHLLPDCRLFDCQLAEFILDSQRTPFPSLNGCLAKYNLGSKLDVVESEYWSRGIDTPQIPLDILIPYNEGDLEKTDVLYQTQLPLISAGGYSQLCTLHMQDLRVLAEMECNGLLFDWNGLAEESAKAEAELIDLDKKLLEFVPTGFRDSFNGASGDHLSALLYGGNISVNIGTPYAHTYKGGDRKGTTETRHRWHTETFNFTRLVEPPEGSGLKKDGFFSVDEETLRSIKHTGRESKLLVSTLLRRSELEKWLGTYTRGIREHLVEYDWDEYIHGTFNQCRVITGRLSSEKPNQQNFPEELSQYIVSRYETNHSG